MLPVERSEPPMVIRPLLGSEDDSEIDELKLPSTLAIPVMPVA